MASLKCTTDKYERLYARWLEKPGKLLDLVAYEPGQHLLDLCGGSGAVSHEALQRGADPSTIALMDLNPRCSDPRIAQFHGDADKDRLFLDKVFDLIVIRQAAAYLNWNPGSVLWMWSILQPGGSLIFNTFSRPKWKAKIYKHGGAWFFEASWYLGRTVWHFQGSKGIGWDITKFRWHSTDFLKESLQDVFDVRVVESKTSQYWICKPKP